MAEQWYKSVMNTPVPHPTPQMLLNMEFPTGKKLRTILVHKPYRWLGWPEIAALLVSAVDEMSRGSREGDKYLMEFYEYTKGKVEKRLIERLGPEPYKKRI